MYHQRCVFRDNPDPNDPEFFEKLMAVIHALEDDGVHLDLVSDETSHVTRLHQMTWQATDEELRTELSVVRDLHDDICYATIQSRHAWIVKRAMALFAANIATYQMEELLESCRGRFYDARDLIAIGLVAKKQDADVIRTIAEALDHDSPRQRYCAARAAAITQWSVFAPDLEMMLKMETDPAVREMAEHALKVCTRG